MNASQENRGVGAGDPRQAQGVPPPAYGQGVPAPGSGVNPPGPAAPGWANRWSGAMEFRRKAPALAGILSGIMPGLGHVYVGYYKRGFLHFVVFASIITALSSHPGNATVFLGLSIGFFYLYGIVDAVRRAAFYNHAMAGMGQGELPEDFKMPGGHGSMVGGVTLVALGVLFIAHTRFGYDLDWMWDWWPLALVGLGLYLVYESIQGRKKA